MRYDPLQVLLKLLTRPDVSSAGGVFVLRYAPSSIALWCALPVAASALCVLSWGAAHEADRRWPALPKRAFALRLVSVGSAVFSVLMGAVFVPGIATTEVRISANRLTETMGLWFKRRDRVVPLDQVAMIIRRTRPDEFERRTVWTIHYRDGTTEQLEPGDLISANARLIVKQLEARRVLVVPSSNVKGDGFPD